MDAQLDHLARIGLTAAAPFGFVLAGGHAMVAHQLLDRPTEDLDLFTNIGALERFGYAVAEVVAFYEATAVNSDLSLRIRRPSTALERSWASTYAVDRRVRRSTRREPRCPCRPRRA